MGLVKRIRDAVDRKLDELSTCPQCKHLGEVDDCGCRDPHCVCNPDNH